MIFSKTRYVVLLASLLAALVFGQIPRIMNYQGKLTNPSGIAIEGDYSIDFRIYAVETGGSYIWHQTKTVAVTHGLFDVQLDLSINGGDTLSFARPYWITIQIASDPEMLPREKLAPVSYAYRATYSDTAEYAEGGALPTGTENQVIRKNASEWEATSSMVIESSGDVGIGITSPSSKLDVAGDIFVHDKTLLFTDPENSDALMGLQASDLDFPDYGLAIRTAVDPPSGEPLFRVMSSTGSERLRVEHNGALNTSNLLAVHGTGNSYILGDLGVSTTTPAAKLDVDGVSYLGYSFLRSSGQVELGMLGTGDRYSFIDFHGDDTHTDNALRFIRSNTGENAPTYISHSGSGSLILEAEDGGDIRFTTNGRIGIGTTTPDASAAVEIVSNLGGLLIPRMTEAQRDAINVSGNPDSDLIFNTTTACFEFHYAGSWYELGCAEVEFVSCGDPIGFTYNGSYVIYGTVEHNGECWLDRNLGATQVATASNDYLAYGDIFQWGRGDDDHQSITWTGSASGTPDHGTTSTLSSSDDPGHSLFVTTNTAPRDWRNPQNATLWQGESGTNNPCPEGWRLPTSAEWETERATWSPSTCAGAFSSPLKLPAAGYRYYIDGVLSNTSGSGVYWSSTVSGNDANAVSFSSSTGIYPLHRASGNSVRCIKD